MRQRTISGAAVALPTLLILGVLWLTTDSDRDRREQSREFQQLTRGLGFGPVLDLSECDFSLDPRLAAGCPLDLGPVAGGKCFCRQHTFSVFFYSEP